LLLEARLSKRFPSDRKYSYENKGKKTKQVYSEEYVIEYDKLLNGLVEQRMTEAVSAVGCFWYTAWVNAGKPDLNKLIEKNTIQSDKENEDSLMNKKVNPFLKGHEDEN
jgi:hypothetical protein